MQKTQMRFSMSYQEIKNLETGRKTTKYSDTNCNSSNKELTDEYYIKDRIKYCFPCAVQEYQKYLASNLKFQILVSI